MRGASANEGIVSKRKWLRLAVGDESKRGLGFIDFVLVETHGLVETVRTGRLKADFLKLLDGVSLGFAKPLAAGVAPFERIVRQEFDARPPRVPIEVWSRTILLRRSNCGTSK